MADIFTLSERHDLVPSFSREGGIRRVLRRGRGRGAAKFDETKFVQLVPPGENWSAAKVFTLSVDPAWLARHKFQKGENVIVATSLAAAKSYCQKRFTKIADQTAGAAKDVLAHAMAELSTRPVAPKARHSHAAKVASGNFRVAKREIGANGYEVDIEDSLAYASDALRGGAAAVNVALMKAANKIAGQLTHHLHRHGDFSQNFGTPFPEVKRARRTA